MEIRELPQIIGADEPATRARCQAIFGVLTHTNIVLSSPEAAELTKLIDNSYRDVMFAFANEIASLCSHAGLSALDIIRAGKLGYPRTNVALPGLVGGPCLEKDPHILVDSARDYGVEMAITAAARATNEPQPSLTMRLLRDICRAQVGFPRRPVVTVAGLAFKGVPPTDDLRGTMAKHVIAELRTVFPDATLRGYDPVITEAMVRTLDVEPVGTLAQAFEGASIVVLANNHPEFQKMDLAALAQQMTSPGVVYDYWNLHEDTDYSMPSGVMYLALGSERYRAT